MYRRIRDLREDKELKQENIAMLLNITRQQYGLYETGKRTIPIDLLIKLSKLYNTSADYIIGLTNEIKPYPRSKNILEKRWKDGK